MRTLVRRFVLLTTLVALLLGVMGATAPAALAGHGNDSNGTWVNGINVDATTIPQLQRLMDRGRLTSVDLVKFYLRRIHRLNPKLNAVITVSPTALKDARAADKARRHGSKHDGALHWGGGGGDHGSLLGIPVIVKDNIDTTGMPTTAGSWALAGSSPRDSFIVKRLKAAGAIVIAKANLSEWANFRSNPSSSGWSGIGGQTNMAYVLDRNPCGSSSGTGVAVSADLATVGVGTETDGSVVCPSGANGLVGIKPTLGLVSRTGIVPISAEQDTAGPMARNVTDAAVLLGAMTGIDRKDAATAAQAGHARKDYTRFLDKNALKGARIGVWREGTYDPTISPEIEAMMNATVATLKAQGATIVDPARIPIEPAYGPEFDALLCEFKSDVASYLQANTRHRYPKTLQDLIDFNNAHPELEGPWNSALFDAAQATGGRADPACTAAAHAGDVDGQGGHRRPHGGQRPRRDHRADQRAGLGDRPGERRPRWRLLEVRRLVEPVGHRRLPRHHRACGLRGSASAGRHVHRRALGRAGADRPRLRVRAGDPRSRPTDVPRDLGLPGGGRVIHRRAAQGGRA